jgi:hypothetical protein
MLAGVTFSRDGMTYENAVAGDGGGWRNGSEYNEAK